MHTLGEYYFPASPPHFGHRTAGLILPPAITGLIARRSLLLADPARQAPQLMHEALGMNFKHYHEKYPDKTLRSSCGNSNIQNNYPIPTRPSLMNMYNGCRSFQIPHVNSASFFILSSQDTSSWRSFWRTESGAIAGGPPDQDHVSAAGSW
jgi:hypothetical protein